MSIRATMRHAAVAFAVCASMIAVIGTMGVSAASAASPIVNLYLTNDSSYCATVQGKNNVSGTDITMYTCASSGSDSWYYIGPGGTGGCTSGVENCYQFQDVNNTNLCLGVPGGEGLAQLMTCADAYAYWSWSGTTLVNGLSSYVLIVTATVPADGSQVACAQDIDWHQWGIT